MIEIKVGQRWKKNEDNYAYNPIVIVTDIFQKHDYTYIEIELTFLHNGLIEKDHNVIKKVYFKNMYTLIPEIPLFRPHWLLDNGAKIYADEVVQKSNVYFLGYNLPQGYRSYQPYGQRKNQESDFGILFNDGSYMRAKWIGEDNE